MKTLWQLKKISTGENLSELQPLPENWGPIFGLRGFINQLNDLSWVGLHDQGWFEVEVEEKKEVVNMKEVVDGQIETLLNESLPMVAADNLNVTKGQRSEWMEYRQKLKEIPLQTEYPDNVYWPKKPE